MNHSTPLSLKEFLEFAMLVLAFVGIIYKVAQVEKAIYTAIDATKSVALERINIVEKRLDVYIASEVEKNEMINYRLHGLNEKVDHKFDRLHEDVKEIQRFLNKNGFSIREKNQ